MVSLVHSSMTISLLTRVASSSSPRQLKKHRKIGKQKTTPQVTSATQTQHSPSLSGSKLRAAQPRITHNNFDVYVGRVHPNDDMGTLRSHLSSMGISSKTDHIQSLTRNNNAKWRSYKISTPLDKKDVVLNSDNWPAGIVVQPFRVKKPSQLQASGGNQSQRQHCRGTQWGNTGPSSRHPYRRGPRAHQYESSWDLHYEDSRNIFNESREYQSHYRQPEYRSIHDDSNYWHSYDNEFPSLN